MVQILDQGWVTGPAHQSDDRLMEQQNHLAIVEQSSIQT